MNKLNEKLQELIGDLKVTNEETLNQLHSLKENAIELRKHYNAEAENIISDMESVVAQQVRRVHSWAVASDQALLNFVSKIDAAIETIKEGVTVDEANASSDSQAGSVSQADIPTGGPAQD
jgi:hypothetical protein